MENMSPPTDKDTLLLRKDAAIALSAAGYPIAVPTLATMASKGTGPKFRRFGSKTIYRWGDLIEWAESRSAASHHAKVKPSHAVA